MKLLKIKFENIAVILYTPISLMSLYLTIKYYPNDWKIWLVCIMTLIGHVLAYVLFKSIRMALKEITK